MPAPSDDSHGKPIPTRDVINSQSTFSGRMTCLNVRLFLPHVRCRWPLEKETVAERLRRTTRGLL